MFSKCVRFVLDGVGLTSDGHGQWTKYFPGGLVKSRDKHDGRLQVKKNVGARTNILRRVGQVVNEQGMASRECCFLYTPREFIYACFHLTFSYFVNVWASPARCRCT